MISGKRKRRGFVMTGGGAKGLYEAGVIHAFHLTGMEFDVITGSSIGAMNSVFYAEYLLHKRELPSETRIDPERAIEALDDYVKAFHHAWLMLPDKRVIDDSETGPLGKLKDDLLRFNLTLPQLTRLAWWWTTPGRGPVAPPRVWPDLLKLGRELAERLGVGNLLGIIKNRGSKRIEAALRTYLRRFGLERSLIPAEDDHRLKDIFTQPVSPLTPWHLKKGVSENGRPGEKTYRLVHPERTLQDYAGNGVDVRVTRANYRTGRLEISAYISLPDFVRYMLRQAWRLQVPDVDRIRAVPRGVCADAR